MYVDQVLAAAIRNDLELRPLSPRALELGLKIARGDEVESEYFDGVIVPSAGNPNVRELYELAALGVIEVDACALDFQRSGVAAVRLVYGLTADVFRTAQPA